MALDYIEKFKGRLEDLSKSIGEANFRACSNISTDLTRTSDFMSFEEGVFIGEFFESLFENIQSVYGEFKIDKDEVESVKSETGQLIDSIMESIPAKDEKVKSSLYERMVRVRFVVTRFQIKAMREAKRKEGMVSRRVIERSFAE